MTWLAWLALAWGTAAECDLSSPPEQPFGIPLEADRVRVVIELWIGNADPTWGAAMLDVLDARELSGVVVIDTAPPEDTQLPLLHRVRDSDHEIAVLLAPAAVPENVLSNVKDLKRLMAPLHSEVGKIRAVIAPIGSRASEAMLGRAGFRALMNSQGPATAAPRLAGHLEGQPRINVVIHGGPYDGPCGIQPRTGPFTPLAADRAARAIQWAQGTDGAPIVRVAVQGAMGNADDPTVLARWIDEVLVPGGVRIQTSGEARADALQSFRRGPEIAPPQAAGGRVVAVDDAIAAAESLRDIETLPRTLPGDLSPTEAFFAFTLMSVGQVDRTAIRLGQLAGPPTAATTSLQGPTEVDTAALKATAEALLAAMPAEVPSAMRVGDQLLTASELLLALASLARGDAPVWTHPVDVIEPSTRGLGWGVATLP